MAEKLYRDEEWLREQLVDQERTPKDIAKGFDIQAGTINHWKRKFDITLPTEWTEDEIDYLKEHAHKMSATDIAEELGRTQVSVNHYAHRHDISMEKPHSVYADKMSEGSKKYKCNQDFFARNTPESNYWAGALLADGCVRERDENSHTISLEISKKDESWLRKFKESLNAEHPIFIDRDFVGLKIHSNKMFSDLESFGVIPRKTYRNIEPSVDDNMLPHFIRGLLDGDGSISKSGNRIKLNLVNNESICHWTNDMIESHLGISGILYPYKSSDVAWNWETSNKSYIRDIAKWLYESTKLYMDRKYNRYIKYGLLKERG